MRHKQPRAAAPSRTVLKVMQSGGVVSDYVIVGVALCVTGMPPGWGQMAPTHWVTHDCVNGGAHEGGLHQTVLRIGSVWWPPV